MSETLAQIINILVLPAMGLIGLFLKTFLGKAISDMKTEILGAIGEEFTRKDTFNRMEKDILRRIDVLEKVKE